MDWTVRRVVREDGPSSLRLKAADLLRLATDARHAIFSREMHELAERFLVLAQRIEEHRSDQTAPLDDATEPADHATRETERHG
jgi:hypothetical protein